MDRQSQGSITAALGILVVLSAMLGGAVGDVLAHAWRLPAWLPDLSWLPRADVLVFLPEAVRPPFDPAVVGFFVGGAVPLAAMLRYGVRRLLRARAEAEAGMRFESAWRNRLAKQEEAPRMPVIARRPSYARRR